MIAGQLGVVNTDLASLSYASAAAASDIITVAAIDGLGGAAPTKTVVVTVAAAGSVTPAVGASLFTQSMASLGGAPSSALLAAVPAVQPGLLVSLLARGT